VAFPGTNAPGSGGNVTVDFRTVANGGGPLVACDPLGIGITISTYSGAGSANPNLSTTWLNSLIALAPGHCRIPLRWNNGNPGSSAAGAQTSGDADTYIANIKAMGAIPFVVYGGDTTDNGGINGTDAAAFVHHYNDAGGQHNGPVKYWVIGNEPNVSGGTGPYTSVAPSIISAMHGADPSVKLSVPASGFWDTGLLGSVAGMNLDILSYHAYDGDDAGTGFPNDGQYYTHVKTDMPGIKAGVMYGVEEVNWHFDYNSANNKSAFYDWHNTLFIADVAGQVLSAGGHFSQYADSNAALGLMNDGTANASQVGTFGTKFPAYWGVGIWTGMNGQFKRWGQNVVPTTTTFAFNTVAVYATDNGKVVICNKGSSSQALTIKLGGTTSGTYQVWKTNAASPTSAITQDVASSPYTGSAISYTIPAQTVVSLEVTDSGTVAPVANLSNNFEGMTSNTTPTPGATGNTGGAGNNPVDVVYDGTGVIVGSSTNQAAHGSLSMGFTTGGTADAGYVGWQASLNGPLSNLYGRAYIFLTANPTTTDAVIEFQGSAGAFAGGIQVTSAGKWAIQDGNFVVQFTSTSTIPLNTWVRIEWSMVVGGAGTGSLTVNYYATKDSATITETHTDTTGPYGGSGISEVIFGWTNAHASQSTLYMDDLAVSTSGYLGPVPAAPTAIATNTFEGGTNGTGITAANSGGTSGTAFSTVSTVTGGTLAYSNAHVAKGSMAMSFATTTTSGTSYGQWSSGVIGTQTTLYGRAYVYLTGSPTSDDNIIAFQGGSNSFAGGIMIASSRQLRIQNNTFGQVSGGPTMPTGQWFRLEWKIVCGAAGSASFTLNYYATPDGLTPTNTLTDTAGGYGSGGSINQVQVGWSGGHTGQTLAYVDSITLNNTGYPGPDTAGVVSQNIQGVAGQVVTLGGVGTARGNVNVTPGVAGQATSQGGVGIAGAIINANVQAANTGSRAFYLVADGTGQVTFRPDNAHSMPVTVGQQITVQLYAYAWSPGLVVHAAIDWLDSSHGYLSTSAGPDTSLPLNNWAPVSTVTATAPANAAYASYGPTASPTPTSGKAFTIDTITVSGGTPIIDGDFENSSQDFSWDGSALNFSTSGPQNSSAGAVSSAGGVGTVTAVSVPDTRTALQLGGAVTTKDVVDGTLVGWSMQEVDITLGEFNDETLNVALTSSGVALNLTGYTVEMYLKTGSGVADTDPSTLKLSSAAGSITIVSTTDGTLNCSISRNNLQVGANYTFYRIDIVDGSLRRNTALYGTVTIRKL
jgi:hypothetical protein